MAEPVKDTDAVADSAVAAVVEAPAADAIDQLLAEFEAGTAQAPDQPVDPAAEAQRQASEAFRDHFIAQRESLGLDQRQAELQTAAQQLQAEYDQQDAAAAFSEIRGSLPPELFDDVMLTRGSRPRRFGTRQFNRRGRTVLLIRGHINGHSTSWLASLGRSSGAFGRRTRSIMKPLPKQLGARQKKLGQNPRPIFQKCRMRN